MNWSLEEQKSSLHGGDIYRNQITHDFSINLNPLGLPPQVREVLASAIDTWSVYPDPACQELITALSRTYQIPSNWFLCGNGAADLIYRLVWAVRPRRALAAAPTFSEYGRALRGAGCQADRFALDEKENFHLDTEKFSAMVTNQTDLVFLCNPNNPNGLPVKKEEVLMLAKACRRAHARLVVDECFCELLEEPELYSVIPFLGEWPEVFVLRAFTKTYAMAGLRLGYGICTDGALMKRIDRIGQPWKVSVPAQKAGAAALGAKEYLRQARELIAAERGRMAAELERLGMKVYPSAANFLLFRCPGECRKVSGGNLWKACADHGILIRDCSNYIGLEQGYYRVCVRRPEENDLLLRVLAQVTGERA